MPRDLSDNLRSAIEPLGGGEHVAVDPFLAPEDVAYWRALAATMRVSGAMRPAAVGTGNRHRVATAVRNDWTAWIEPDPEHPIERRLAQKLEALRLVLNERFLLGLFDLELHLAIYPSGGFYVAHVDRFRDDDHRIVSMIIYLNDDWSVDDGGALRIWSGTDPDASPSIDIAPIGGRLVLFMSDVTLHAVMPTRRDRVALTGWFRRRD
ncbi:MAG: 2OG-Fe(II) oxygenase [Burkholderiales bacterium]